MVAAFSTSSLAAIPLVPADGPALQRLCEQCQDYSELVEGQAVGSDAASTILTELPPGKTGVDKFVFALQAADGAWVGVIDLVRDFPEAGEWFLGLLLLHPSHRGHGHGAAVYQALADWAQGHGAAALRLGVVSQNTAALRFWQRQGFVEIYRREVTHGRRTNTVRVMRHVLAKPGD